MSYVYAEKSKTENCYYLNNMAKPNLYSKLIFNTSKFPILVITLYAANLLLNFTCFLLVQINLFNCLVVWLFLKSAPCFKNRQGYMKPTVLDTLSGLHGWMVFYCRQEMREMYLSCNTLFIKEKICIDLGSLSVGWRKNSIFYSKFP